MSHYLYAVDHWRSYLQHAEFLIKTDHKSLVNLTDQRLTTMWQHKAFIKLLGLQYKITYRRGKIMLLPMSYPGGLTCTKIERC